MRSRPMTREETQGHPRLLARHRVRVVRLLSLRSLAAIIGAQFFSQYPEATRNVFALLAFAAGFLVRPFGALLFGRLGDLVGRKYTFLITILIMGVSTFLVGCLPSYETIGFLAPVVLIALRMAQGLALGGEYGGAAIYVAEHAPRQARLLHQLDPDHGDAGPAAVADRHHVHADLRERQLCRGDDRGRRQAHAVRRLGLAHSVPGLDRAAGDLGLDPAADAGEPGLQEDEGGGHEVEGAADRGFRPVEERQDRAASRCSASSPARPWSGTPASSTRCSSCRAS